jgi:hypothetical protein
LRLFGDCFLWTVFLNVKELAQIFGLLAKVGLGIILGDLFHSLIWSPCKGNSVKQLLATSISVSQFMALPGRCWLALRNANTKDIEKKRTNL